MALTLEVDGSDLLATVREGSLEIEETGITRTATLDFDLKDPVDLDNQQVVEFADGATVLFGGVIRSIHRKTITQRQLSGVWATIHCLDNTVLASDRIIRAANGLRKTNESDKERIEYYFGYYLPAIDASTAAVVETIADMDDDNYIYRTLTRFMDELCKLSGNTWYVDPEMVLHYQHGVGGGAAPFDLSDEPDDVATFAYDDLELVDENNRLANAFYTAGGGGLPRKWYLDPESIGRYGRLEAAYVNRKIGKRTTMDHRAATQLQANAWPKRSGSLVTYTPGLHANTTFGLTSADHELTDEPCLITTVKTSYPTWKLPKYGIDFTGKKGRVIP